MQSNTALHFPVTAIEALRDKFNLSNWTAGDPCSDVNWIKCSGAKTNVESLLLTNSNLTGTIPSEFKNLKSIITIEMSNNPQLVGDLPDLSEAVSLVTFNVSFCGLGGQIPDLFKSGGLDVLHLQNNNFTGPIPLPLFQLPFLRNVNFRNNQLTTVPVSLNLLIRLKTMNLANNLISGILPDLPPGNKQPNSENRLELLTFSNNFFSGGIPESWEQLIYLKEIYLNNNNLTGPIPSYFGKLRTLLILDLRNNQFNGTVPESLAELPNLKTLLLDNNKFAEIPQSLLDRKAQGLNISFSNNPNIRITVDEQQEPPKSKSGAPIGIIAGVAAVVIIGIGLGLAAFIYVRRRKSKSNLEEQVKPEDMPKSAQSFTFKEVKTITSNFKTSIGKGGFGDVYYGKLPDGKEVAVKVRSSNSSQGADEFLNEVRLLSRLHHRNLVCLVGYCLEAQQQILIYVYMPKGTLHDHLYPKGASSTKKSASSKKVGGSKHELLSWKKRVDIVMNAARGLEYLHKDCKPPVIHRDVKTTRSKQQLRQKVSSTKAEMLTCSSATTSSSRFPRRVCEWSLGHWLPSPQLLEKSGADRRSSSISNSTSVTAIEALRDKFNLSNWTAGDPCSNVKWIKCSGAKTNVELLLLTNSNLTGTIPSEFKNLKSIITIEMSNNPKLIGPLPDLTDSKIVTFNVSFCALGGQIPDLKRSGGLEVLHLQNNNFAGPIPLTLFEPGYLRDVNFRNNQLTTMPVSLNLLIRLKTMNLENNLISGILPDLPPGYKQGESENRLELLTFSNNFFSGGIPESWEQLIYLKEIYLNTNNLTGPIPSYFGKLKALLILELRNNQFNGTVPESLAELPNLKTLLLDNNKFAEIPQSLLDRKAQGLNISFSNNPNISITVDEQQEPPKSKSGAPIGIIAGVAAVVIIGIGLGLAAFIYVRRRKSKPNLEEQVKPEDMPKSAQSFTFKEVKTITSNFKTSIGKGGFGDVYYGKLPDGKEVAVKVRASNSSQGADEFLNEVRLLSRLHHRNLVCLVGYCLEAQQQILIYVYMPKGTLHDHLYPKGASSTKKSASSKKIGGSKHELLSWKKRVDIVMNAARGLEYLHKDCKPPVIHRDVKSENILLTHELQAKLADLGISRQAPELDVDKQHVNTGIITMIKGTFGYLDPEYEMHPGCFVFY
ncbi:hypothetical protein AXG93_4202s1020 [Marchantia polymorpha subsp. ruderalis]|uniref:Protein kinase domain-containing protein n=1 Tax=Marchantia polymorpha subsp. ruderalis TaxID=1480154 RepID=A0A176WFV6_MARPO|nr:hypothetical protein AXG93_4202s1020 [Marchantia polymorpha subsp. ruderalis]